MSIASTDVHQAIVTVWDNNALEARFTDSWEVAKRTEFEALNDQEASAGQPWPYCVFEIEPGSTISRMSGHSKNENHEIRDIPISFRVHARRLDGVATSPKLIASDLIEEIMKIYGGHPTVKPKDLVLDNGSFLIMQYTTDWGILTGDKEFQWLLSYVVRIDVPVAV